MARSRDDLSAILHSLCENVYFQPPTGKKLVYPCIVYSIANFSVKYADNSPYSLCDEYTLLYIARDPDDDTKYKIARIPYCSLNRTYTSDNLYHYSFRLFY